MGYHTDFMGEISISPALTKEQANYVNAFSFSRRMKRDVSKLQHYQGKHGLNGEYGKEGEFFTGPEDESVIDYNRPPDTQPGLWCQWVVTDDGSILTWDEEEKFYEYIKWMEYIIENFFVPWGVVLNGTIEWRGEDWSDAGSIHVTDNKVTLG